MPNHPTQKSVVRRQHCQRAFQSPLNTLLDVCQEDSMKNFTKDLQNVRFDKGHITDTVLALCAIIKNHSKCQDLYFCFLPHILSSAKPTQKLENKPPE